jgi:hypothetical protein
MSSKTRKSKSSSNKTWKSNGSKSRSSSNETWKPIGPNPKEFYTYEELVNMDKRLANKLKVLKTGTKVEIKAKNPDFGLFYGPETRKKTLTGKFMGFSDDMFLIKFDDKIYLDNNYDVRIKYAFLFRIIDVPVY